MSPGFTVTAVPADALAASVVVAGCGLPKLNVIVATIRQQAASHQVRNRQPGTVSSQFERRLSSATLADHALLQEVEFAGRRIGFLLDGGNEQGVKLGMLLLDPSRHGAESGCHRRPR